MYDYLAFCRKDRILSTIVFNSGSKKLQSLPITFVTACDNYNQESIKRPLGIPDSHQILFVLEGNGTLFCNNKRYKLKKGCAFFTALGVPSEYVNTGGLVTAFVTLRGKIVREVMENYNCNGFLFREDVDTEKYLSLIKKIISEYYDRKREGRLSSLTYSFFVEFFEDSMFRLDSFEDKVSLYLERNFTKKITLEEIASLHKVSVSKLCHDFKKKKGITVFEYLLELRLTYARNLTLNYPNIKIVEIALSSGFDDVSYFCRKYKQKFLKTPSQDRKDTLSLQISEISR